VLAELPRTLVELFLSTNKDQLHDGDMQCLAQLQGLRHLAVSRSGPGLTDHGLLALTALTNLEKLQINDLEASGISGEVRHSLGKSGMCLSLKPKYSKVRRKAAHMVY